ncbi:reverse transcriptase [Tanacetum coccineum]
MEQNRKSFQNTKLWKDLAHITKKNAFEWDDAAQMAFSELKQAMTQALVLALPNFQKTFVVEIDASSLEIGAVLQQEGHLITYLSKTLSPKHQSLSIYEKEFFVVLMALEKWRGNLLDRHFKIKIYYFSLKYLLDQRLTTPFQTKWLPKLLGYDYEISYKKGNENIVADALSRVEYSVELNSLAYQLSLVIYFRRSKMVMIRTMQLRKRSYMPEKVWSEISMDFVVGLPKSQGKTVIFVVVDRLIPNSIVSDRDVFLSHFWQTLFKLLKVELKMSTTYHPQTDEQTEVVNKCLE